MRNTGVNTEETKQKGVLRTFALGLERKKLGEILLNQGYITQAELKFALNKQAETKRPIGHVFLEYAMVTKKQLFMLLAWQKTARFTAAFVLCFFSLIGMGKKAKAESIRDIPAQITLAMNSDSGLQSVEYHPALFGADEKFSPSLKAFTKWTAMFDRLNETANAPKSRGIIDTLKIELAGYKSSSIAAMAQDVNSMMNRKKYIVDNKNWGKSDYWATPVEFMARGGDCEDFAIAKYVALRALGVPEDNLRIAIVHDMKKNIPHAILVVYSENGALILDNQIEDARPAGQIHHYKPIFSINRQGWWLHTTPKGNENTVVASAR